MKVSKPHYKEYKSEFENNAVKTFDNLEEATGYFSGKYGVDKNEALKRIENNTNADWIVSPNGKVYVMN